MRRFSPPVQVPDPEIRVTPAEGFERDEISRDTLVELVPSGAIAEPMSTGERIGSVVHGRYRLDELLGSGAMGAVFGGSDLHTRRRVAVKILHDRHAQSGEHVARFLHEAQITQALSHPGVVEVIEAGRDDEGRWFMVIEHLEGEDLGSALERGAMPGSIVVEIGHQLLATLAAAHGRGVIHRDVKPENIFLAQGPKGGSRENVIRVKLLDFGIAKAPGIGSVHRTLEGVKLGTPHYMSPEQWRGESLDARSDVWAAGAVLFAATMGEPPFDAEDIGALMDKVTREPAPSLAKLRPDLGPAFTDTIDRALATEPLRRWVDARAMAAALHTGGVRVDALDWDE